eukprot:COSAG02_NODE_11547_length_1701_cov_2.011860_1_plen_27_part_10
MSYTLRTTIDLSVISEAKLQNDYKPAD